MMTFPSEILSKQHLQRLNGKPFWIIRSVNIGWFYAKTEYDYFCYQIVNYNIEDYPTITIAETDWHDGRFTMVFVRQTRDIADPISILVKNPPHQFLGWALGDYEDFQKACLVLKLKNKTLSPLKQIGNQ